FRKFLLVPAVRRLNPSTLGSPAGLLADDRNDLGNRAGTVHRYERRVARRLEQMVVSVVKGGKPRQRRIVNHAGVGGNEAIEAIARFRHGDDRLIADSNGADHVAIARHRVDTFRSNENVSRDGVVAKHVSSVARAIVWSTLPRRVRADLEESCSPG